MKLTAIALVIWAVVLVGVVARGVRQDEPLPVQVSRVQVVRP